MTQSINNFGYLLRQYRRSSIDPLHGGPLTQQRLVELLEDVTGFKYSGVMISNWEREVSRIDKDSRPLLIALIKIFQRCGAIETKEAADRMLQAGNYRKLDEQELLEIGLSPDRDTKPDKPGSVYDPSGSTNYDQRQGTFFQGNTTSYGDFVLGGKQVTYVHGNIRDSSLHAGEGNVSQTTSDRFSSYVQGVETLLAQIDRTQPQYMEALSYQQQLEDNIHQVRQQGDTLSIRTERADIIERLNRLSLDTLNTPFDKLCVQNPT